MGDDRDSEQFQAVEDAIRNACTRSSIDPKRGHHDGGGHGESEPRGEGTAQPPGTEADPEPDLAAGRSGDELAKRDQVGVGSITEPPVFPDDRLAEVAEVRDRATERCQPKAQEDAENLGK